MFAFLLTLLILDALLLSVVVLLQSGQGGGLASLGGGGGTTDTVLGGRHAVTLLTKATWWCGGIFLVLALALSLVPHGGNPSSLQQRLRATTPEPATNAPLPLGGTPLPPAAEAPAGANSPAKLAGWGRRWRSGPGQMRGCAWSSSRPT